MQKAGGFRTTQPNECYYNECYYILKKALMDFTALSTVILKEAKLGEANLRSEKQRVSYLTKVSRVSENCRFTTKFLSG